MSEKVESQIQPEQQEQKINLLSELKEIFEGKGEEFTFQLMHHIPWDGKGDPRDHTYWKEMATIEPGEEIEEHVMHVFSERASNHARHSGAYFVNLTPKAEGEPYKLFHPFAGPITFMSLQERKKGGDIQLDGIFATTNNKLIDWIKKLSSICKDEKLTTLANEYANNFNEIMMKSYEKSNELIDFMSKKFGYPASDGTYKVFEKATGDEEGEELEYKGFVTIKDGKEVESQDGGSLKGDIFVPVAVGAGFYCTEEMIKGAKKHEKDSFVRNVYLPGVGDYAILDSDSYKEYCELVGITQLVDRNSEIEKEIVEKIG